jgi:hypothetical protein
VVDKIMEIMSGIKELELQQHHLRNALEAMCSAKEAAYQKGYNDAMGWKTQNHLEHLPTNKEWVGLTGQETNHLLAANVDCAEKLIRAIEAKLKEKNLTSERSIQTSDSQAAESSQP